MGNALIDLGEVSREKAAVAPGPPVPYRLLLGALSLVLLALLTAAVHHSPPQPPQVIAARLGDLTFVRDHLLFVVTPGPELPGSDVQNRIVSTYTLPAVELVGLTTVAVSGSIYDVRQIGDTVVVAYQVDASGTQAVVGLTAGTDKARWRRAARLIAVSAADHQVLLRTADAQLAVDLTDGTDRWSVPYSRAGMVIEAGWTDEYPRWLVMLTEAGRLVTYDARTGAMTATVSAPRSAGSGNGLAWPVGDLMLIDSGPAGTTAYHLPDLVPSWHSDVDLSQSWMQTDCGTVICTFRPQRGMTVLDPATGRPLWSADRWAYAEPMGAYLVATVVDRRSDEPQQWILDPATGRVLGDFGPWQGLGPGPAPGLIYGRRDVDGEYVVWYGVLDPKTRNARILGAAERVSGDCQATSEAFICRLIDASVAVWRLR
ncbi:hypothetical protein ACWKSP_10350 [Micromonosporaceae bacterium Da 78-11]